MSPADSPAGDADFHHVIINSFFRKAPHKPIRVCLQRKFLILLYSIGDSYAVALYLKQFCTRATSGPFDWLGNGTFKERTNSICNHFLHFS